MNLKLHIKRADGRLDRIAGDEADPRNVPANFTRSSAIPGGWTSASFTLPRSTLGRDFDPFDELVVMGDGNQVLFEGYGIELPVTDGDDDTLTVTATGWSSVLKDNPCPTIIAVDRDLSQWEEMGLWFRGWWQSGGYAYQGGPSVEADGTGSALVLNATQGETNPTNAAWYKAGPDARVGSIYYEMTSVSTAAFTGVIGAASHDSGGAISNTGDLLTGTNSSASGTFTALRPTAEAARYAYIEFFAGGGTVPAADQRMVIKKLTVYGAHPIPQIPVAGEPNGVLASDVLAHLLETNCPQLNVRRGPGGIEATTFVIPHLVLRDVETLEDAVLQVNRFDVNDWGVYTNRTPFLRPPGTGRTFVARTDDHGVTYNDAGITGDELYTGVIVRYSDPAGKSLTVGPPGSGCDTETPALAVAGSNPLTKRGRRRVGPLSLSDTAVERDAIQTGSRWLHEKNLMETRGDAEISGWVRDTAGIACPVSDIKAGDQIIFPDREWRPRRIVEETWSAETDTISLSLDSTPSKIDAMMERMGVFNEAVGV